MPLLPKKIGFVKFCRNLNQSISKRMPGTPPPKHPFSYSKQLLQTLSTCTFSIKHSIIIVIYKSKNNYYLTQAFSPFFTSEFDQFTDASKLHPLPQIFFLTTYLSQPTLEALFFWRNVAKSNLLATLPVSNLTSSWLQVQIFQHFEDERVMPISPTPDHLAVSS